MTILPLSLKIKLKIMNKNSHQTKTFLSIILTKPHFDKMLTWGFFIVPYFLDRFLKVCTHNITYEPVHFLFIGFFSSFSKLNFLPPAEIPSYNFITALLFCFLSVFIFFFINYIFTYKHLFLRISFSLFFSGLSSFIVDFILEGEIVNNLALILTQTYFPFSLALFFFLAGSSMFFYFLTIDRKNIIQKDNIRKTILLKNKNQNHFIRSAFYTFSLMYFIIAVLIFVYFTISLSNISPNNPANALLIKNFLLFLILAYLLSTAVLVTLSILYSHRIYGPVYGFQRYMKSLSENTDNNISFKIRKNDHFQELEKTAEYIRTRLMKK